MLSTAYFPSLNVTVSLVQEKNETLKMNRIGNPIIPEFEEYGYRALAIINGKEVMLICERNPINFITFKILLDQRIKGE
ncbi:hypothetical protein Q5A_010180 [Serratia inhibens PRI-2C]|nr:hypothetical protein Q5A_010180 [Serratia inhibens PRI-2C]